MWMAAQNSESKQRSGKARRARINYSKINSEDLKDLGVAFVGDRRRLLDAIALLRDEAAPMAKGSAGLGGERGGSLGSDAERRQLTVMFCDLVGSTALSARLDPEDLRAVIGRYHACAAQTVARHDGFLAKYMGDGVLVYFGYPQAHEDDAEQAVRSGLALIDSVSELPAPQRLQVRIGIATGLVVVGDLIGAGSAQEQSVVGETPNLAARLQALAEPNAIVIAETTRRQIGALFELGDLGPQHLKGFAEAQHAWRVVSESRALGRFEALRSGTTPLVGREEELEVPLRRCTPRPAAVAWRCSRPSPASGSRGSSRRWPSASPANRIFGSAIFARRTTRIARCIRSSRKWNVRPGSRATTHPRAAFGNSKHCSRNRTPPRKRLHSLRHCCRYQLAIGTACPT
jgi:class 3 adenylate cyclase